MKVGTLKQVIAEWLEEQTLPPLIKREIGNIALNSSEIIAIVGPRRAGKTYLMYQLIEDLISSGTCDRDDILFLDLEDYRLIDISPEDINSLFAAYHQLTGKYPGYVFFDEIHNLPNWDRVIRTLHNQNKYSIVVSGSNSELLREEVSTALRGRYRDILLFPFSFREVLLYKRIEYSEKLFYTPARGNIIGAFDEYLREGGFPEVLKKNSPREKRRLLQNYFRTIFYRDIIDRYNIKAKYTLESIMGYCLDTFADLFSISAFEKYLKSHGSPVSKRTISNYLLYLEEAFFLISHKKFSYSPRKRIMNPRKIYLLDTGFSALSTEFSGNKGKILENVVAIELHRRNEEVFYSKGKYECDFIIKRGTKVAEAIQVCWEITPGNRGRELRGLVEAMNSFNVRFGCILTYNEDSKIEYEGRTIPVLPVWKWLLMRNSEE